MDHPPNPRRRHLLAWACAAGFIGPQLASRAAVPAAYQAMSLAPQIGTEPKPTWEFDLRPAQQRARQLGKRIYLYLAASDCHFCREYEAFLNQNADTLAPAFREHYLLVQLMARLDVQAPQLVLRTDTLRLPYADFQRTIGDQRARLLVYPCIWLLDADAKPLMQMPAGAGTFQTVAEQMEILRLEQ